VLNELDLEYLPKSDVNSLDFGVRRFLMKLFKTVNNDVIQDCCNFLKFDLPSDLLAQLSCIDMPRSSPSPSPSSFISFKTK